MSAESIVCSNYFHYRYTPVSLDIIIFSLTIRKCFDFVAMLKHDMFRSMFPIPFSKHTFWFFIVLFSILRQAVYNSQCPSGSNHCFI